MINVACAIIIDNRKVFVAQRSECMKLPLKWEFPGGKIENNESAESCIEREIHEELNIEVDILDKLGESLFAYPSFTINLIPFVAKIKSGELVLREHKTFKWLPASELENLDWAPADIPVLQQFMNSKYAS